MRAGWIHVNEIVWNEWYTKNDQFVDLWKKVCFIDVYKSMLIYTKTYIKYMTWLYQMIRSVITGCNSWGRVQPFVDCVWLNNHRAFSVKQVMSCSNSMLQSDDGMMTCSEGWSGNYTLASLIYSETYHLRLLWWKTALWCETTSAEYLVLCFTIITLVTAALFLQL